MKNMPGSIRLMGMFFVFSFGLGICSAQKLAITFDDLPLNGELPPGVTRAETAKNVLEILKKRHVPPVYGFVNAKKLEGNADGAEALKLWAATEPVGNHTYSHMEWNRTLRRLSSGISSRTSRCWNCCGEMRRTTGAGCAIPTCMRAIRRRSGAWCGLI